jgi:hypothetical protein
MVTASNTYVAP